MLPAFQAFTTAAAAAATCSPAWPAHQIGDLALLFVTTSGGQTIALTTPNGFVQVSNSPQTTGTGTAGTKIACYWARATSNAMAAPVITATADFTYAVIITFRNILTNGDPTDTTAGSIKATGSTTFSAPCPTTSAPEGMIVVGVSHDLDSATAQFSGWTQAGLISITEQVDAGSALGLGGGLGIATGVKSNAGASGNTTGVVVSSINAYLTVALKSERYPVTDLRTYAPILSQ